MLKNVDEQLDGRDAQGEVGGEGHEASRLSLGTTPPARTRVHQHVALGTLYYEDFYEGIFM